MDRLSRTGRLLLAVAMTLCLVAGVAAPASARAGLPLVCQTSGIVTQTDNGDGTWNWDFVIAFGQCFGDFGGPYAMTGAGSGTSTGLGLCDGLLVQNLQILMNLHLVSALGSARDKFLTEVWSAPISTYPVATPFLVSSVPDGGLVGAGAILSHIGLKCPPAGTPGAVTIELRLSPS
jgi:hypothetical protein